MECHSQDDEGEDLAQDILKSNELEALLNQLNRDGELQDMISQERMRTEMYRDNYAWIKDEYVKLAHENRRLTSEISRMECACNAARSTALAVKQQSEVDMCRVNEEVKMLETKVPSAADRLDTENKTAAAFEDEWRHRVEKMAVELDTARMSVQSLLSSNLCLKAEARSVKEEASRNLEQERIKFGAELSQLKKLTEDIEYTSPPDTAQIKGKNLALEQDNVKLRSRCKYLESCIESGLETLRRSDLQLGRAEAEKESMAVATAATVKRLEAEKAECNLTLKSFRLELSTLRSHSLECESEVRRLKSELEAARCSVAQRESCSRGRETALKIEIAKERAAFAAQLDEANKQLKTLKTEAAKKEVEAEGSKLELDKLRQGHEEIVEIARERATFAVQLDEANRQINVFKAEAAKKALEAEGRKRELDKLRQGHEELLERMNEYRQKISNLSKVVL